MKTLHLVDDVEYVKNNCFQHQLSAALQEHNVVPCTLQNLHQHSEGATRIVSTLKLRTITANIGNISRSTRGTPFVVYDQDPWEAYRVGSPYRGTYEKLRDATNLHFVALTTKWWVDYASSKGIPTKFVRMWVLPQYCHMGVSIRPTRVGFVGQLHGYRKELFDAIKSENPKVITTRKSYRDFLSTLSTFEFYVHNEAAEVNVGDCIANLKDGLWIKDIEAMARGCISIRNFGQDSDSYLSDPTSFGLFNNFDQIPSIITRFEKLDPEEKRLMISSNVEKIMSLNCWADTAKTLVSL